MDTNYVHQLVVDNEIGLALTYMAPFGFDVTVLLSNYNDHHSRYMQGTISYAEFSQHTAIVKSAIVNMASQRPPSFDTTMIVKATVIIVASKNNAAYALAVKPIIEQAGYLVTITEALESQLGTNISAQRLLYIITDEYFELGTKWPISLTSSLTHTISLLFDDSLNQSNYLRKVADLNKEVHDLTDAINDGIRTGFPVGALANRLVHTEQAKLNIDRDFNYLWTNPPIDCSNTLFQSSMPTVLEKLKNKC